MYNKIFGLYGFISLLICFSLAITGYFYRIKIRNKSYVIYDDL